MNELTCKEWFILCAEEDEGLPWEKNKDNIKVAMGWENETTFRVVRAQMEVEKEHWRVKGFLSDERLYRAKIENVRLRINGRVIDEVSWLR